MSHNKIKNPLRYHGPPSTKLRPQFRNIDKTLELLEKEDSELKTKLLHTNCSAKLEQERDNMVWEIEKRLDRQDEILDEIKMRKTGIEHLKLGIKEVDTKSFELAASAISDFQYSQNLNRASRIKENLESRFAALRKSVCILIAKNARLNEMIDNMMTDRQTFCKTWMKLDHQLAENKKFLLAKTDKLAIVFGESDYLRAEMRAINEKARRFEAMHLAEARNMVRKDVVDENALKFMAIKRSKRLTGSEANKFSTLVINTIELNTQMNIRKLSLTKEIQDLFTKINAIFQVLNLDDRLDEFNIDKKKEIEYEVTKAIATLEIQLNQEINAYVALKNPHTVKRLKKADQIPSRERIKPSAAIKNVVKREESVLPVDVDKIRKERFLVPATSTKTASGHLVDISKESSTSAEDKSSSSKKMLKIEEQKTKGV